MPMPETNKAPAMLWAMAFGDKVDTAEAGYHAWQLRGDEARRNRKPEKTEALRAKVSFAKDYYNTARANLFAWVIAHPAPPGAAEL